MSRDASGPFSKNRRLRVMANIALLLLGLFLTTLPAWAVTSEGGVAEAMVAGAGGVLIGFGLGSLVEEWLDPTFDSVVEAFSEQLDDDSPDNFRGTVRGEVRRALAEVATASVDFGPRGKLSSKLNITAAQKEILIQSISLSQKWQVAQQLEDLFGRYDDMLVRVCLMHPYSDHVAMRERDLGFRRGTIRQLIDETLQPLISLRSNLELGDRLQVRGYRAIPYFGLQVVDRKRLVVSLSREGKGGDQNTAVFLDRGSRSASDMIDDLLAGFETRWQDSTDLLETVNLSFVPGSESLTGSLIRFLFEADRGLTVNSVVCSSSEGSGIDVRPIADDGSESGVGIAVSSGSIYEVTSTIGRDSAVHSFEISQAATESGAWLRSPLQVSLPPPRSLTAAAERAT